MWAKQSAEKSRGAAVFGGLSVCLTNEIQRRPGSSSRAPQFHLAASRRVSFHFISIHFNSFQFNNKNNENSWPTLNQVTHSSPARQLLQLEQRRPPLACRGRSAAKLWRRQKSRLLVLVSSAGLTCLDSSRLRANLHKAQRAPGRRKRRPRRKRPHARAERRPLAALWLVVHLLCPQTTAHSQRPASQRPFGRPTKLAPSLFPLLLFPPLSLFPFRCSHARVQQLYSVALPKGGSFQLKTTHKVQLFSSTYPPPPPSQPASSFIHNSQMARSWHFSPATDSLGCSPKRPARLQRPQYCSNSGSLRRD